MRAAPWLAVAITVGSPAIAENPFDLENPYEATASKAEKFGQGPHTLVISDQNALTRINYPTGARCLKARDEIRRQVAPPPNTPSRIYGQSSVKAFCVPR